MSTQQSDGSPRPGGDAPEAEGKGRERPAAALIFDDPLGMQSADDTDRGWGEDARGGGSGDLDRFLSEKPPHHI